MGSTKNSFQSNIPFLDETFYIIYLIWKPFMLVQFNCNNLTRWFKMGPLPLHILGVKH